MIKINNVTKGEKREWLIKIIFATTMLGIFKSSWLRTWILHLKQNAAEGDRTLQQFKWELTNRKRYTHTKSRRHLNCHSKLSNHGTELLNKFGGFCIDTGIRTISRRWCPHELVKQPQTMGFLAAMYNTYGLLYELPGRKERYRHCKKYVVLKAYYDTLTIHHSM